MNTAKVNKTLAAALAGLSPEQQLAKINELRTSVQSSMTSRLVGIHTQFGYDSANAFIQAVRSANSDGGQKTPKSGPSGGSKTKRAKRASITQTMKNRVISMTKADKSAKDIASAVGLSVPSVFNIRKSAGLVKARGAEVAA